MPINDQTNVSRDDQNRCRILSEISELSLELIPTDWVDSVFAKEFTDFEEIPSEYLESLESLDVRNVFESLLDCVDEVKNTNETALASLSDVFSNRNLLALLCRFLRYGTDNVTIREHRVNALLAARLYFRFLMLNGAKAYSIYHSRLFAHSISCLGFPKLMCEKSDSYKTNNMLSNDINIVVRELSQYVDELKETVLLLQLTPVDMDFEIILSNLIDVSGSSITQMLHNVGKYLKYSML